MFVLISSASVSANSGATRSSTASELSRKSAEVPGVTWSRTLLMNESLMPTSASDPASAPAAAPIARPSSGTKKIMPNSRPQKPPPSAPPILVLCSWRVFGLLLPSSQLTTAASRTTMSSCCCRSCSFSSAASAPKGAPNFHTVSDAMSPLLVSSSSPATGESLQVIPAAHVQRHLPHLDELKAECAYPVKHLVQAALIERAGQDGDS